MKKIEKFKKKMKKSLDKHNVICYNTKSQLMLNVFAGVVQW